MSGMVEVIQKIVENELKKIYITEIGVVTSIFSHESDSDKDNYECNVQLKYRDLELRKVPVATNQVGFASIPKVGDLVVVSFINGNINSPIIIGRLYNDEDRPPASSSGELVYVAPYSEDENLRRFHMKLPSGVEITVNDGAVSVMAGKTHFIINKDGDVELVSEGNISVKAKEDMSFESKNLSFKIEEAILMEAGKTMDVKLSDAYTIESTDYALKTQGNMAIDVGGNLDITATGNISEAANANLELKATGMGTLEASGPLTVKGATVAIN
jgi:phage gp45-like